jgi:elongator complex protein 1
VDVAAAGYCEVLAVLLSDGQLVFFRSVESDLWEETLEDQVALGGPKECLLPLGFSPPAAAATAAAAAGRGSGNNGMLENDAEYYGGLSVPTGPWSRHYGSAVTGVSTQGGDVQRLQFPPLSAAAGSSSSSSSGIPLAEGRAVLGLVWLGQQRLLLLAAPLEEGLEDGQGTVLIEVSVTLPTSVPAAAAGADSSSMQQCVETESVCVSYAGGWVLTAASHPAGGAVLQLSDGKLMYYPNSSSGGGGGGVSSLLPLPAAASFPCSCPLMLLLPHAPHPTAATPAAGSNDSGSSGSSDAARQAAVRVAAAAPAVGLSASGVLYWGSRAVAADVYSVAVRGGGPGGPALLYVTRQSLLYVLMVGQLPKYQHTLVSDTACCVIMAQERCTPSCLQKYPLRAKWCTTKALCSMNASNL